LRWTSASWLIELFFDLREDAFKSNTIAVFVWDYNILPVIKDRRRTKGAARPSQICNQNVYARFCIIEFVQDAKGVVFLRDPFSKTCAF